MNEVKNKIEAGMANSFLQIVDKLVAEGEIPGFMAQVVNENIQNAFFGAMQISNSNVSAYVLGNVSASIQNFTDDFTDILMEIITKTQESETAGSESETVKKLNSSPALEVS